jgi:uncharacterized protein
VARDLPAALKAVVAASPCAGSALHGESHWRRVAANGLDLADADVRCDREIVVLFAMVHDAARRNDGWDRRHGERAAGLARALNEPWFGLTDDRLALLAEACARHSEGRTTADPTIAACWDSDRLDLIRLAIEPRVRLMSTPAGRGATAGARAKHYLVADPTWSDVFQRCLDPAFGK